VLAHAAHQPLGEGLDLAELGGELSGAAVGLRRRREVAPEQRHRLLVGQRLHVELIQNL